MNFRNFMWTAIQKISGPSFETTIWQREWNVYKAMIEILGEDVPCTLGGKYTWITSPTTGMPLQIDIFYPKIQKISGIKLATPKALAIEVQSSLHDGKWNKSKSFFFRTKAEFDNYTRNQEWKRSQILGRNIPFLEIDPSKDDLSSKSLRLKLSKVFGFLL